MSVPRAEDFIGGLEDIRKSERDEIQRLKANIDALERHLGLCDAVAMFGRGQGFQQFCEHIEAYKQLAIDQMVESSDESKIHMYRGSITAYKSILRILRETQNVREQVAAQLALAKKTLESRVVDTDRLKPVGGTSGSE